MESIHLEDFLRIMAPVNAKRDLVVFIIYALLYKNKCDKTILSTLYNCRPNQLTVFLKDKELIQHCKKNNYKAQMQVYNLYKRMLYNASWRIFKNRQDAEDAVQDAFIKGFQKIHQLKDDANLGAWLKRIAINRSLDIIRKRTQIWVDDVVIVDTEAEDPFIEDDTISIDFIKKCIDSLDDKYRIILILYLIEDYTHREISAQLNLKESTVRNQYRRGKLQLLQLIKNSHKNEFKAIHSK